ncbi:uncharacterized protein LOC109854842 [Pseudomyrmex gracilis]|uniref:uncharacterized protein LOC109854842 n=1 Tax=Pseudomyrmex gracilis TaxID=219809 RepID=UPI000994DA22|nr:uncharacterized protein LOC109854842 [Pseudomyrmex gracilis]
MASLYGGHDYYRKMFELQEKLRKSEEERIRLEERFNVLVRDSRNRHETCMNRLRMRYIQYMEEQRTRDERNHKLLAALDKVMNKLALISAKKDRLNILRKQYETHLLRVYANRPAPGSVTGDSGIASQNEDKYTKKIAAAQPNFAETKNVSSPRVHPGASVFHPDQSRSIHASKFHDQSVVNGALLNNSPIFVSTPTGASLDYRQGSYVPQATQDYVSPIGQSSSDRPIRQVHPQTITVSTARPYSQTISGFDGIASRGLQDIPNINVRVPYETVPVLSEQQIRPDDVSVNRFFKEHVEAVQAASGLSQFPAEKMTRYEETSPTSRQFLSPASFPYRDANAMPSSPRSQMRRYDMTGTEAVEPTSITAKSSMYRIGDVDPLPGYMDYTLTSPRQSEEGSVRSLTSDDVDDLIKQNEHMMWTNVDVTRTTPRRSSPVPEMNKANLDENGKTTAVLENELDRYISNIRKLHREHGVPSLDELDHEQNTSGDLLNVTLSEDALELSAEERARKERVPEEMGKVLALADDLVTKTAEIAREDKDEQTDRDKASAVDKIRHHNASKFEETREGRKTLVKTEIREDVAEHSTKLEQPRDDVEIAKESRNNFADDSTKVQARNQEASGAEQVDTKKSANNRPEIDQRKNVQEKMDLLDLVTGEESDIEGIFDVAEKLEPWNIESVEKQVRELRLNNSDREKTGKEVEETTDAINVMADESRSLPQLVEQSDVKRNGETERTPQDALPQPEIETKKSDTSEGSESNGRNEDNNKDAISSQVSSSETSNENQHQEPKTDNSALQIIKEPTGESNDIDNRTQNNEETTKPTEIVDQSEKTYEYEQGYVEDPNQQQQYEQQDPNEQYQYEQNVPYEGNGNEEYNRYTDQGYAQEGQEYVEYVDGQYEQYAQDPNNQQYQQDPNNQQYQQDPNNQQYQQDPNNQQYQQDPNDQQYQQDPNAQYEQDPNQAYDYNYDPNQEYAADQQYDPNQGYGADPNNQAYDYTEQTPYDSNQMYDNTTYDQYKEEQRIADEGVVDVVHEEEKPATKETSRSETNPAERKSDEDKPREEDVDTTNQSRKKKDVIKSLLDSDTDTTTIERNASNTESDFDFN